VTASAIEDAFSPLSVQDRWRVERFIRKVNDLKASTFVQQPIGMSGAAVPGESHLGGQAWEIGLNLPSEESLKAIIGDFRQLYTDSNKTSAASVLNILKRSAHDRGTDSGVKAIAAMKELGIQLQSRRKRDPVASVFDAGQAGLLTERSPGEIIAVWFNGEYFHDEPKIAAEVEVRDDLGVGMFRMSLHTAIRDYLDKWIVIANTAQLVLVAFPAADPG
jgi:hypothetical protein